VGAANGYVRSEAVCVIFLQKACDAKRVYAKLVHAKTNSEGFKKQDFICPSREMKKQLLEQFYEECGVNPTSLDFLEAHGIATKVSLLIVKQHFLQENLEGFVTDAFL
jgi:fatty acid synthase